MGIPNQKIESIFYCTCEYIYIYYICIRLLSTVGHQTSVDLSLSLNGYILISFLHHVNEHHRACPTNIILLIIIFFNTMTMMRRDAALVVLCCLVCLISKTTRTAASVVKLRKLNKPSWHVRKTNIYPYLQLHLATIYPYPALPIIFPYIIISPAVLEVGYSSSTTQSSSLSRKYFIFSTTADYLFINSFRLCLILY